MNINSSSSPFTALPCDELPAKRDRDAWQSVKRGAAFKCPKCGKGKLFYCYLKVNDRCPVCGEELFHHRADDAPTYLTILVTSHVIRAGIRSVEMGLAHAWIRNGGGAGCGSRPG